MSQVRILSLRPSLSTTYVNSASSDTKKTQLSGDKKAPKAGRKGRMPTFPVKLSKGSQVVTIYAPSVAKPSYRVVFRVQQDTAPARNLEAGKMEFLGYTSVKTRNSYATEFSVKGMVS